MHPSVNVGDCSGGGIDANDNDDDNNITLTATVKITMATMITQMMPEMSMMSHQTKRITGSMEINALCCLNTGRR